MNRNHGKENHDWKRIQWRITFSISFILIRNRVSNLQTFGITGTRSWAHLNLAQKPQKLRNIYAQKPWKNIFSTPSSSFVHLSNLSAEVDDNMCEVLSLRILWPKLIKNPQSNDRSTRKDPMGIDWLCLQDGK